MTFRTIKFNSTDLKPKRSVYIYIYAVYVNIYIKVFNMLFALSEKNQFILTFTDNEVS